LIVLAQFVSRVKQPTNQPTTSPRSTERQSLLTSDELAHVPFLVLGNKIDVPRAVSEEQLRYALGLQNTFGKEVRGVAWRRPSVCVSLVCRSCVMCVVSVGQ
jgi:signal recognition particle receptor subunit beta